MALDSAQIYKFDQYAKKQHGQEGEQITLCSNFFKIQTNLPQLFHYNVEIAFIENKSFDPSDPVPQKIRKTRRLPPQLCIQIFDKVWKNEKELFDSEPIYDGYANLFTVKKLPLSSTEASFEVEVQDPASGQLTDFKLTLFVPTDDSHVLNMRDIDCTSELHLNQMYAIDHVLKNGPRRAKHTIANSFFYKVDELLRFPPAVQKQFRSYLKDNKELSFGYYMTVRHTELGLLLNLDRTLALFSRGGPAMDIIENLINQGKRQRPRAGHHARLSDTRYKMSIEDRKVCEIELRDLKFVVNHLENSPRYIFNHFSPCPISRTEVSVSDSNGNRRRTNVLEQFKREHTAWLRKHQIELNPNLPCMTSGREEIIYFPIEVCEFLEDQEMVKKPKSKMEDELTMRASMQAPSERFDEVREFLKSIKRDNRRGNSDYLKDFKIQLKEDFVKVNARVLEPPTISFGEVSAQVDGVWDLAKYNLQLEQPCTLANWIVVNIRNPYQKTGGLSRDAINRFGEALMDRAEAIGMCVEQPGNIDYNYNYIDRIHLEKDIFDFSASKMQARGRELQFILFFIPGQKKIYNEIKAIAELKKGVITQCISHSSEKKFFNDPEFIQNVLLKINSKLQGTNIALDPEYLVKLLCKCTTLVGLDVLKPNSSDKFSYSIASCVSSYDPKYSNYSAQTRLQARSKDEICDLTDMIEHQISYFYQENSRRPKQIIIFRNTITEGKYDEILCKELDALRKAFRKFNGYNPKMAYIAVQKDTHVRFMNADSGQNVEPGTVVDNGITSNELFSFYLVSHHGEMGVSKPVEYTVLYDEIGMSADSIQKAIYHLCYLYPCTAKPVAVPPPVSFSRLAAKRVRDYVSVIAPTSNNNNQNKHDANLEEIERINSKLQAVDKSILSHLYYI